MCSIELFLGILSSLGEKQADKNITGFNFLVIFVLQTGFRHGIEKVFPTDYFEINTLLA